MSPSESNYADRLQSSNAEHWGLNSDNGTEDRTNLHSNDEIDQFLGLPTEKPNFLRPPNTRRTLREDKL